MTTVGSTFPLEKNPIKVIVIKRIKLIEKTLSIYSFLYQAKFYIKNKNAGQNEVTKYLSLYKEVAE
jgi:hypothetical protein